MLLAHDRSVDAKTFKNLLGKSPASNDDLLRAHFARCKWDIEYFINEYFSHYTSYAFSSFHRDFFEYWEQNTTRGIRRVIACPRGYGKSVIVTLLKVLHDIVFGRENYIVLVSNTQVQAIGKSRDVRTELLTNRRLQRDFGIKFATKKPAQSSFEVETHLGSTMVHSIGAGTEVRGLRYKEHRPSCIILDDSEHSDHAQNEELREGYEAWFFEVIQKLGDPNTNIYMVGTVLHRESLLMRLVQNPAFDSQLYKSIIEWADNDDLWDRWKEIYSDMENPNRRVAADKFYYENEEALLEGTKVLWPEKEPYKYLMEELIQGGKRSFMKEKQNEPMGADDALFTYFEFFREVPEGFQLEKNGKIIPWKNLRRNCYGVIDPATGQTKAKQGKKGDYACILVGFEDPNTGRIFVYKDITKRIPPTKQIDNILDLHQEHEFVKFGIEVNLFRGTLRDNLQKKEIEQNIIQSKRIPCTNIHQTENKEKRIFTLEPKVSMGKVVFNRALSRTFFDQIEAFPYGGNDDAPDALHMLEQLVNEKARLGGLTVDRWG